jgi:ubiquinone/menaquinone biosynthesis C-methylase UbiE
MIAGIQHKAHQQNHYDHNIEDPEFEIARPRGTGRFYNFLMHYKVRRAVSLLGRDLDGSRVIVLCAGSGMDAELLLQYGPQVVCLDISPGALVRAAERARRYGLAYGLVAGDAECLPFPDGAFDYAFVHDGLHHLADPEAAISEMARVARCGVVITEPADAFLSAAAIRLGLISAVEPSGNRVFRLHPTGLRRILASLGMRQVRHRRYLVKYPHKPGRLFRLLDLPVVFPIAKLVFRLLGAGLLAGLGNKLALVAMRTTCE